MDNLIIVAVLLVIIGLATWYVIKSKKSGQKCIGCPNGCCPSKMGDGSACSGGCGGQKN